MKIGQKKTHLHVPTKNMAKNIGNIAQLEKRLYIQNKKQQH